MSYQTLEFLLFSACVLLLYYAAGRRFQRYVLLAANLFFYAFAGLKYLPFLLVTLLATYFTGRVMGAVYEKADEALAVCTTAAEKKEVRAESRKKAKKALLAGLIVTVALLAVCKYTGFVIRSVNSVLSLFSVPEIPVFRMILPLGISFYSFMALSYILDVYWKRYPAEKNFLTYAAFLTYFPHIVQGPIDRFNEFRDQIKDGVAFDTKNLAFGAELALWGFFKKLVIADRLNLFVSHVFDNWSAQSGAVLLLAVLVYSVQIYADFSGCIDIVSGISEMFGIRLRKNFNHPYFSKTMGEFWRRWHISLQEWFKDYVFYPVFTSERMRRTKKKLTAKGKTRAAELFSSCFPILVVWLITGIWHGAAWNYVLWGIFHAILLIGSQILDPVFKKTDEKLRIRTEGRLWRFWQMLRTFLLCGLGRIFFRSADVKSAFGYIWRLFGHLFDRVRFSDELIVAGRAFIQKFSGSKLLDLTRDLANADTGYGISPANILMAAAAVLVLWIVDMKQEKGPLREALAKRNIVLRWFLIFACLFAVILFGIYGPGYDLAKFIYEQY